MLSHVRLLVTPQTVACQAPLTMGFPKQEYSSGLPFPPPGDLPDSGIKPALAGRLYPWAAWEALIKASSTERERKEKRKRGKEGERGKEKSQLAVPDVLKTLLWFHLSECMPKPSSSLTQQPEGPGHAQGSAGHSTSGPQGTLSSRLLPFPLEMEISSLPWDLDLRVTFLEASSVTRPHTVCTHTHKLSPLSKFFSPSWIFLIFFFFNWHLMQGPGERGFFCLSADT